MRERRRGSLRRKMLLRRLVKWKRKYLSCLKIQLYKNRYIYGVYYINEIMFSFIKKIILKLGIKFKLMYFKNILMCIDYKLNL